MKTVGFFVHAKNSELLEQNVDCVTVSLARKE
jgi:hypothetical protein